MCAMSDTSPSQLNHNHNYDQCNVFVKYLPPPIGDGELYDMFQGYGPISSSKVMINQQTGESLGYGFVRFMSQADALCAIQGMDGQRIMTKTLLCKLSNTAPSSPPTPQPSTNLYVKPLPTSVTENDLKMMFEVYGKIIDVKIMMDKSTGQSRGVGFVRFEQLKSAVDAVSHMSETDSSLIVKFAESKHQKAVRKFRTGGGTGAGGGGGDSPVAATPKNSPGTPQRSPPPPPHKPHYTGGEEEKNIRRHLRGVASEDGHPSIDRPYIPAPSYSNSGTQAHPPAPPPHTSAPVIPASSVVDPSSYMHMHMYTHHAHPTMLHASPDGVAYMVYSSAVPGHTHHGHPIMIPVAVPVSSTMYGPPAISLAPDSRSLQPHLQSKAESPLEAIAHQASIIQSWADHNASSSYQDHLGGEVRDGQDQNQLSSPPVPTVDHLPPSSPPHIPLAPPDGDGEEPTNLFCFHLPSEVSNTDLYRMFSRFGALQSVRVITDKITGASKGYGFVKFYRRQNAEQAITAMNGCRVGGKHLKVEFKDGRAHHASPTHSYTN
eukprot:TRINITY_DN6785_c0_g1_i1.p1 TRINITY_DN6785_c0_g1~~TRINITY_DN6785_c0_g1_i1.p1  ORF type:complete len:546 (-),score=92.47 TRINITY_DN6785_c0_g1_i1:19-1656(-)